MGSNGAERRPLAELGPRSGAPGSVVLDAAGPLAFHSINPFRAIATPEFGPSGALPSDFYDVFDVWRDVNNNQQIPSTISAVTFNITITQTVGAAFLAVIPAQAVYAGISTINWTRSGVDLANNGTVGVGPDNSGFPGCVVVGCGGLNAATQYIFDVTGYYV